MAPGQIWWITGASSGIGEALATAVAAKGARVILSGRNVEALERVAQECARHGEKASSADNCLILPFETTDYAALPAILELALAWGGQIDCLVNNAGISQRSLSVETEFAVYERIIAVDLLAPIALSQAVLPHMVARGSGRLIAISSVAGIIGAPLRSAYSAAKHGIFGYFDSVRAENQHHGIDVHVIAPGSIKTNVSRNALAADGKARGQSDAAIENGMLPGSAASAILAAVEAGTRELILATGTEEMLANLRRSNPDALFDALAASVQAGYADKMAAGKAAL